MDKSYSVGSLWDEDIKDPKEDAIVLRVKSCPNEDYLRKAILFQAGNYNAQQIMFFPHQLKNLRDILNNLDFENIK